MMNDELELANPEKESAARNGLITLLALVTLGIVSGYASGRNWQTTILETVAVGTTAASVAFVVGLFFR